MENFTCTFGSVSSNELMTHFSFVLERRRDYVCQFWSKETKEIVINFKQIVTNVLHSKWNRKITQFFIWWWKPKKKIKKGNKWNANSVPTLRRSRKWIIWYKLNSFCNTKQLVGHIFKFFSFFLYFLPKMLLGIYFGYNWTLQRTYGT